MKNLVVLLLGAVLFPAAALAWGPHSHEVVAEIAARHLQPAARLEVERLLGDRADLAMREMSTWADRVREQPKYRDTAPLHYVNFPRGVCRYDPRRYCRDGSCVVGAIGKYVARLADAGASKEDRAEALAFVIHFVSDIHQPLHAAWRDDRGGNDVQIRIGRKGSNLHALWDDALARRAGLRVREHANKLLATPLATERILAWSDAAPMAWAEESCAVVTDGLYPEMLDISNAYLERMLPVAEERIELAGQRLAALLNAVLK
ncbi:MAG: S1/P1 nuclease [Pseudomonadota bacterium]|nr:S1/P1 nuclease [Pseudomonadota bacterium]